MSNQDNQHDKTKIYRFTQQLLNYQGTYFEMEGTIDEILDRWYQDDYYGALYRNQVSNYNFQPKQRVKDLMKDKKVFIEIVDDSCYSLGWITKIEEILDGLG